MSNDAKAGEQTLRFENYRKTEFDFRIEPEGFCEGVPPGQVIEVVFTPYKDYKPTIYVGEDGEIIIDLIASLTVYLDGLEIYTNI